MSSMDDVQKRMKHVNDVCGGQPLSAAAVDDKQNQLQQADELAGDIFRLSRNTLMINLRFLDVALIQFIPAGNSITTDLATDGQNLYYNAWHVLRSYKAGREIVARDYLHAVLHCVFRHLFINRKSCSSMKGSRRY